MIISHTRRFIFFHNPRCAGTSFRSLLSAYHDDPHVFQGFVDAQSFNTLVDYSHLRLWELRSLFPAAFELASQYRSVICVRKSSERFVSAVAHHFHYFQPDVKLAERTPATQITIIEAFVEKILTAGRVMTDFRLTHFSPQVWFILMGGRSVPNHIVPVDNRGDFGAEVLRYLGLENVSFPHQNRSPISLNHLLDSPKITKFIRDFYACDSQFFSADPALRHLAEM